MKTYRTLFLVSFLFASANVFAESKEQLVEKYLNDPDTPSEFKKAIRDGIAVKGMCPFQVFAAAGFPGPYMVKSDKDKWKSNVPPPVIINAQCKNPERVSLNSCSKTKHN